ncbi:dipeptide ABC transporter ATP-binding protein [Ruegeria atlantica]|uniref:dipeptide ABC transporter ATP-binding protein n=1 Tax=Ruegeria atlantica TaxID=81569 RepID=UPI00147DD497|nr:ABC transporter ATP-binding protein [Ruegeria atlantica]
MSDEHKIAIRVRDVSITFPTEDGPVTAVKNVSFDIRENEFFGIVGESGSGKSTVCRAITRLLPDRAEVTGEITVHAQKMLEMDLDRLRDIRGNGISMIFQNPSSHLNPLMTIGDQISETARFHYKRNREELNELAVSTLKDVRFSNPEGQVNAYPHQLSGGMKQRAMIGAALACDSKIIIADEPTTALDVTVQAEILDLLIKLRQERGLTIIIISHDLGVISQLCDRIAVMKDGELIEQGRTEEVILSPKEDYTRTLIASRPEAIRLHNSAWKGEPTESGNPVLAVNRASIYFGGQGRNAVVKAVEDVSFDVMRGDIVGVVGESGSGKSTIVRAMINLNTLSSGEILYDGRDVRNFKGAERVNFLRKVQMIFQHPQESLDPRFSIEQCIMEPLKLHKIVPKDRIASRVRELMEMVELSPDLLTRRPRDISGGQAQRVCIARALAMEPEVIIADEITSALDVTIQAQILRLLTRLKEQMGLTIVFVTHDLDVVRTFCNRVVVMQIGKLIETGTPQQIFETSSHDYTRRLVAAIPHLPQGLSQSETA